MGLTGKQRAFVEAYCGEARGNATEAARLAGYKGNAATLAAVGYENLKKPHIFEAVENRTREVAEARGALTPDEIHEIWASIARDEEQRTADRLAAVRDAARAGGMFLDRVEHSGAVDVPVRVVLPDNGRGRD